MAGWRHFRKDSRSIFYAIGDAGFPAQAGGNEIKVIFSRTDLSKPSFAEIEFKVTHRLFLHARKHTRTHAGVRFQDSRPDVEMCRDL